MGGYAWVTLATNDAYSLGALVLAHSLRRVGTKYELAVLITPGVTQTMREKLSTVFSVVMEVNVLDSKDEANLALLARPELGITFTKLHCWRLTQYEKCVFLDADTLVVRNCDELFEREELSAAPDVGWPDCFNSGVFVYKPSQQTFASITAFAAAKGSFDGGDQGLLNMYFSDWARKDISKHLPFIYNMCSTATYSYLPAFKQFGDDVRIIHFIGITKPWLQYFDTLTGIVQPPLGSTHLQPLLQLWWNIFCESVHSQLSPVMGGLAGALAQMTLGEPRSAEQIALEEHMRKQSWEQGQIDYMGRDSFDNIWKKICETLALAPSRLPSPPKETEKPAKTATDKTDSIKDDSIKSSDTAQSIESVDEVDKGAAEATTDSEEQSLVNNVPITSVPKLSETNEQVTDTVSSAKESEDDITQKISVEPGNETLDTKILMQTSNKEILEPDTCLPLKETPQQTTAPIALSDPIQSSLIGEQETITERAIQLESNVKDVGDLKTTVDTEQTKQTDIKDERYAEEPCLKESTASEILTVSPVPIQVAESVLQVEPKESAPDSRVAPQEALLPTITSDFSVETEDKGSAPSIDSAHSEEELGSNKTAIAAATAESIDTATKLSEPPTESKETSLVSPVEEVQPRLAETPTSTQTSLLGDIKTPEESIQKEEIETEVKGIEGEIGTGTATEDEKTKMLSTGKTPVRPSRAKEATAPTPSTTTQQAKTTQQDVKGEDKAAKKPVKKPAGKSMPAEEPASAEAAEGDGSDKKSEKKVTKKVIKKTKSKSEEGLDDGADDNNSGSKQKKTVKVVKKTTKPSQSSSTETTVPESPSSSTSDAPVPPKRKTKPVTPKSVGKKPDTQ